MNSAIHVCFIDYQIEERNAHRRRDYSSNRRYLCERKDGLLSKVKYSQKEQYECRVCKWNNMSLQVCSIEFENLEEKNLHWRIDFLRIHNDKFHYFNPRISLMKSIYLKFDWVHSKKNDMIWKKKFDDYKWVHFH